MNKFLNKIHNHVKKFRNDVVLRAYLSKTTADEEAFVARVKASGKKDFLVVIAFEQPLVTSWMLELAQRFLTEYELLILDNSRDLVRRAEIKQVCQKFGAFYLGLPPNKTRHVNRSHGLAMTWGFEHVIRRLEPDTFGFLDHDMLPIKPITIKEHLSRQACYGVLNPGYGKAWNLWAGYCFYRYSDICAKKLNFLYDFSRKLDTGGRNWEPFYSRLERGYLIFCEKQRIEMGLPASDMKMGAQLVDDQWAHIGSIGYNDNFSAKRDFYLGLMEALRGGFGFDDAVNLSRG